MDTRRIYYADATLRKQYIVNTKNSNREIAKRVMERLLESFYSSGINEIWPAASLRRNPVDNLVGVHNVACFAVHAIGRVDLQAASSSAFSVDHLINTGRTEALAGVGKFDCTA